MFKGSEYRFPPPLALATTDTSGVPYHGNDDSTLHIIPFANISDRRADTENDGGSDTASGQQRLVESI